jgi:hypothetical protein
VLLGQKLVVVAMVVVVVVVAVVVDGGSCKACGGSMEVSCRGRLLDICKFHRLKGRHCKRERHSCDGSKVPGILKVWISPLRTEIALQEPV